MKVVNSLSQKQRLKIWTKYCFQHNTKWWARNKTK